ncbi:Hint domain-containing protein [Maritimibacter sp. DP1N21-5]|uniref:Hint domain-containing protein n=1 Tax=Maritimibacter sp. DP1N21-5 TaxID=2836867 RepID=UPI00351D6126
MRVDGPQGVLKLGLSEGEADIRGRAARKVRRILGPALPIGVAPPGEPPAIFEQGFTVTDGYKTYPALLIDRDGRAPLVMFCEGMPPAKTDLWVVEAKVEAAEVNRVTDQPTGVICFTPGTRIRCEQGDVAVEDIREGDRVQTKDNGFQEVLWIGAKRVSGARLFAMPELRPVRLAPGALGVDRPDGTLVVSPAHRLLLKGRHALDLFGTDEVLVAARDLIDDRRVVRDVGVSEVTYVHLMLPRHEVVFANGLETESFLPEGEALAAVEDAQRDRLFAVAPELSSGIGTYGMPARRLLTQAEAAIMGARI